MGYLFEKYRRVIKAPYYLYFKECREIRRVVRNLRMLYVLIYRILPQKVEVEHKIRESLKLQRKVLGIAHNTLQKDAKLAINIEVQEEGALDIIKRIEDKWLEIKKDISKEKHNNIVKELRGLDADFIRMIRRVMQKAEEEDKGAYNDVMNIIRAAEKTDKIFMAKIKTYFKKMDISRLERWAGKWEALSVRKYINALKVDNREVKRLITELDSDLKIIEGKKKPKKKGVLEAEKDFEEVVRKLRVLLKEMEGHIAAEFLNAYKIMKRDLMLVFVLLNQLDDFKGEIEKWVSKTEEPTAPERVIYNRILKAEEDASNHARTVAQGLRRLFHTEQAIEYRYK